MNSNTVDSALAARAARPAPTPRAGSEWWIYLLLATLLAGAWAFSRLGLFQAGDDVGYALGVAGGTAMLLLFSYPLRKYVRVLHRLGAVKWWFIAHMVLGVAGPLLILLHSTFRVGSLNAAVALTSMLVVAASGVVGRFIYLRVHRGLDGEKASFDALRARAGFDRAEARSRLHFAPAVEDRLQEFADGSLADAPGHLSALRQVLILPIRMAWTYWRCSLELRRTLHAIGARRGWRGDELRRRQRLARKLVRRYLGSVVRVAQFSAWVRLFALWHVAHVPFVYLMVVSAVVHVVAVHAY
ncbi:MAG: hypothetical protein KF788_15205 [Piscinibacter sp.]|nr:hypothetical protein [Piscinibacter sp.]